VSVLGSGVGDARTEMLFPDEGTGNAQLTSIMEELQETDIDVNSQPFIKGEIERSGIRKAGIQERSNGKR